MGLEAWFMEENDEDKRLPHHRDPKEFVPLSNLAELGVLYWNLNPKDYENDEELRQIRESRGYNYMDLLDLCPERVENYEEKLRNFYREHIHADEEIRYCLEGSGYFDVRDKDDRWVRIWIKEGDMIILPAGIYHRFTLDTGNYIKIVQMAQVSVSRVKKCHDELKRVQANCEQHRKALEEGKVREKEYEETHRALFSELDKAKSAFELVKRREAELERRIAGLERQKADLEHRVQAEC